VSYVPGSVGGVDPFEWWLKRQRRKGGVTFRSVLVLIVVVMVAAGFLIGLLQRWH
jgi:hypothetical protein